MKKYLLIFVMLAFVLMPVLSHASTIAELQALIVRLQAQIRVLQQQQAQQDQGTTNCSFSRDLSLGDGENDGLTNEISALHKVLIASGDLRISKPTGWYGKLTLAAVKNWQIRNGLSATGMIGSKERAVLCGINNSSSGITINSVSGPNSLAVNQTGTWKVNVTAPSGIDDLTYRVAWGEEDGYAGVSNKPMSAELVSNTGTFTHSYSQAGTYTVRFTVSGGGFACSVEFGCRQKYNAETSMTVVVKDTSIVSPSVTVVSPNGGEILELGNSNVIKWNTIGFPLGSKAVISLYDTTKVCAYGSVGCSATFPLFWNSGIENTGSYTWNTSSIFGGSTGPTSLPVSVGDNYKIKIDVSNGSVSASDMSDGTFSLRDLDLGCQYFYWHHQDSTDCGYKKFCGSYMYYGLETFDTKEACVADLNAPDYF
jgi:peptidoglycan hydrolase-like protein with peptidoglycan-binding domain